MEINILKLYFAARKQFARTRKTELIKSFVKT